MPPRSGPLRVGRMPYLNVAPFYHRLQDRLPCVLVDDTPARLGQLAREGQIDMAPLSLLDGLALESMEPLGDFGVACRGPVGSVLLFSERPLAELSNASIRVTPESVTSVRLLQVLLHASGASGWRCVPEAGDAVAELYIGDGALREVRLSRRRVVTDLCEEWSRRQGLPFVFARWMIRRDVSNPADVARCLGESLEAGMASLPTVLANGRYALQGEPAESYLRSFIYRLDANCLAAIERFRQLLVRYEIH